MHVKTLSDAHAEDKKHIQGLERELNNCFQEIGGEFDCNYLPHLVAYIVNRLV